MEYNKLNSKMESLVKRAGGPVILSFYMAIGRVENPHIVLRKQSPATPGGISELFSVQYFLPSVLLIHLDFILLLTIISYIIAEIGA